RLGGASPVPTLHPGGVDAPADTVVIEFPVERSPILVSLRASGPLGAGAGPVAGVDSMSLAGLPSVAAVSPATASGATGPGSPNDGITFSGLKSVSVEVGANRGASLEQSLDLTVRGRVAGDVEVAAMLSDRRLPFEPDGSSRELEDLDRLSLQIRSSKAEATMGDFFLDGIPGQFARMTRQLEGVRGQARVGGASWNVAAASTKGEKRTLEFRGEEGRQGPYPLVSAGLAADAPGVVAGSEVVWLDGARLKRGADDDYIIDYGAGTVTFTVRHPVTAQSRIAVDFEAATSRYRRSLYSATTQGGRPGGAWYASYVHEGDDPKNPMGVDLTAADRAALNAMGDSATTVLPSGVSYAGPGKGSYAWDESNAASPHWIYLGAGRGDYDVQFASVGPGRGAYADTMSTDGTQFYRFRGVNLGSYDPGRPIAVPNSRRLVDLGGSARLFHALSVEGEAARSDLDRNALSTRDDGDNAGGAARLSARLDPRPLRLGGSSIGAIRAEALIRSTGATFDAFDRIEPAFEAERWNQSASSAGENRQEFALQYDASSALSLRGELGQRLVTGGSRSLRRAGVATLRSFVSGAIHWEEADNAQPGDRGARSLWGFEVARDKGFF
ncbi:MAG: hypothetical protein ACRENN_11215, partial [Candidatus Eiseniibacteriota bacterium]